MRRWARVFAGIVLSSGIAAAQAHAHLRSAVPADGSVVSAPPSQVVLDFSEPARLTAAWIQRSGGPKSKIERLPRQSAASVAVPLPALSPGLYELSWRALSADGHIVPGRIHFTVTRPGAARGR
ncbi:MAG: copper resistance CopC family protein [Steroidobacteraceae bacterium]